MTINADNQNNPPKENIPPSETVNDDHQPEAAPVDDPAETEIDKNSDPLSEIADSIAEAKPEKQDHFVEATRKKNEINSDLKASEKAGHDWTTLADSQGYYWNAEYCLNKVDPETGIPQKTARGLWKLKRGMSRKKLSKTPPNIEAKQENAKVAEEAQASAELEAARINQQAIMTTKAILAGHRAIMSQVSGDKAVQEVMEYQFGEGQFKIKVSDLLEASGTEMMIKRGGGPSLSPELLFFGGLAASTGVIYFHPDRPERRKTFFEWLGLKWHRFKGWMTGRRQKRPEQEKEHEV